MPKFVNAWGYAWRIRAFRDQLLVSMIAFVAMFALMRVYLEHVAIRVGPVLNDPVLALVSPVELQWVTFSLIYSGMLLGLVSLCLHPSPFLLALRAFVLLMIFRIVCLFLLPLNPPAGIIPLADPILQVHILHPDVPRALFFSWDTAIMALLAFTARWNDLRIIYSCAAVVISILFLIQHVHYTIDVIAAPCFAYAAYGLARLITIPDVPDVLQTVRADRGNVSKVAW